jgi:hypothetical protein
VLSKDSELSKAATELSTFVKSLFLRCQKAKKRTTKKITVASTEIREPTDAM